MINIATPVSHLFLNKNLPKEVYKISDCFEARERTSHLRINKTYLYHIDIDLTAFWNESIKTHLLKIIKPQKKLKLVTFQITRCCQAEKIINGKFKLIGKKFTKEEMFKNSKRNLKWFKSKFGKKIKIGIENNNYYKAPAYDVITESKFITDIVKKNKIFFLLDVAHAMVTAKNRNIDLIKYLNNLPLDSLIQIHICGPLIKEKYGFDQHRPPQKFIYEIIRPILEKYKSNINYLTLEYYRNEKILIKELKRLRLFVNSIKRNEKEKLK